MKFTDITNDTHVSNVEVSKAGAGLNLYYEYDKVPYNITGEFYIDRNNVLHHCHIDDTTEILVKLEF